jgi:hypothetical protein
MPAVSAHASGPSSEAPLAERRAAVREDTTPWGKGANLVHKMNVVHTFAPTGSHPPGGLLADSSTDVVGSPVRTLFAEEGLLEYRACLGLLVSWLT